MLPGEQCLEPRPKPGADLHTLCQFLALRASEISVNLNAIRGRAREPLKCAAWSFRASHLPKGRRGRKGDFYQDYCFRRFGLQFSRNLNIQLLACRIDQISRQQHLYFGSPGA